MAAVKLIVLFGLFAVALGFTIPGHQDQEYNLDYPRPNKYYEFAFDEELPVEDNQILIRNARSPQGSFGGSVGHNGRDGTSASLNYNHRIGKNFEAYGEASRNFRHNDNSGMVGVRYRF